MTSDELLVIAGAVLAILFAYVPKLAPWFKTLNETYQRLIMLGVLAVTTGAIFGLSCAGIISKVTCDKPGAMGLVVAFFYALISNQGTYSILPKVGANARIAKNVILTSSSGGVTSVGMTELGTTAEVQPDKPAG